MADWVLGSFHGEVANIMREAAEKAADALECCIREGIDTAMNRYNG